MGNKQQSSVSKSDVGYYCNHDDKTLNFNREIVVLHLISSLAPVIFSMAAKRVSVT